MPTGSYQGLQYSYFIRSARFYYLLASMGLPCSALSTWITSVFRFCLFILPGDVMEMLLGWPGRCYSPGLPVPSSDWSAVWS